MLVRLMEHEIKPVKQVVATADVKRGAPIDTNYIIDVPKNYDGINAVIEPGELDFEDIKAGQMYNRIPVLLGDRYATTEVDGATALNVGDTIGDNGTGKFASTGTGYIFGGEYDNPFGVKMYIVEKV